MEGYLSALSLGPSFRVSCTLAHAALENTALELCDSSPGSGIRVSNPNLPEKSVVNAYGKERRRCEWCTKVH